MGRAVSDTPSRSDAATGAAGKAAAFEAQRPRLVGIAYRMLGSLSEAEDMVQETYLRWHRAELAEPAAAPAWLTTTLTRLCIDHLRSARVRRESYVGPWLPEPLLVDDSEQAVARLETAEALSMALLMVLETLNPRERAAFLLHDVFDYGHDEIAGVLETSATNSRQIVKRARDRVHAGRPRFEVSDAERVRLRDQFMAACEQADLNGLLALFTDDIAITSDGGGKAKAALNVVRGADKVARFLLGLMKKAPPGTTWTRARINTEPGMLVHIDGVLFASFAFDMADGRIQGIAAVLNPDKLPSEAGVGEAATP